MGQIAKEVGNQWRTLPADEKSKYEERAKVNKDEYDSIMAKIRANEPEARSTRKSKIEISRESSIFPLARVKKIIKLDEDVKRISPDALFLFSKATEMFLANLAVETEEIMDAHRRRTVKLTDLNHAIHKSVRNKFLQSDFERDYPIPKKRRPSRGSGKKITSSATKIAQPISEFFVQTK